ncbi:ABC transporter permease [Saccharospirillum sp. MSK14-1]|uniref:FecCD family ABC transporter permease n=1 Tax=Saccharospirillum sp. MSK14-1 TaxID=1897632 RepID=UPI000D489B69|nr:iron ABC transporter permease [Saccharospirillum sp. MSK14-1]PTY38478.1 ABC transporter permease [Saccharospirillum sp. MSK14-1]
MTLALGLMRRTGLSPLAYALFGLLIVLALGITVAVGVVPLSLAQVGSALLAPWQDSGSDVVAQAVVWELRLPRAVMALLVGAALATAGAAMQGLFGNPLADPGIVGVSSGASLGAVAIIVLQINTLGSWTLPAGAFVSGFATTWLIYLLARPSSHPGDNARLLLIGIAINAVCGAVTGYLTYLASVEQLEQLMFWSMGSLGSVHWVPVMTIAPIVVIGVWLLRRQAVQLDLLALGERQAQHAGVDVPRLRLGLIALTALLTAAAVAFTGTIGFVGLVIPHLIRTLVGPGHRHLLPLSALGGGLLLMLADLGARSLDPPNEIPIGILTATIGGPFFLWLIARQGRAGRL